MRNVAFVAPFPMDATLRFAAGLGRVPDVRLLGVLQQPPPPEIARLFADVLLVSDVFDPAVLSQAAEELIRRHGPLHRLTGILEPLQVPLAEVRALLGLEGPDVQTATNFRDKSLMKEALRSAGVPVARHRVLTCTGDGTAFADEVGLPIVLKPLAGAGCRSTWRIDDATDLREILQQLAPSRANPVLAEEFLVGDEHSLEVVVTDGKVRAHSGSRYLPSPLEAMRSPWIQWVCLLPKDIADFAAARDLAQQAVTALGLKDGMAHMEWFRRPDGSLAVGEIAARPPGGQLSLMTGLVHDIDIYRTWGAAVVDGTCEGPWPRPYAAATVFLRGGGQGRVARSDGLDAVLRHLGPLVTEVRYPKPGAPKSDSYEGDGFVVVRDPDEGKVRQAVQLIHDHVRIRYVQ